MSNFHLAGVIPVSAPNLDFNMPWHDSLMPIGKNYLAIERSVLECAYAGCETIWLVCDDSIEPLVRKRIGDYVQDPIWINRKYEKFKNNFRKRIPVYYVPSSVHDRGNKDSLGWSALHGCYMARKSTKSISRKLCPDMYYICFPYGVYDIKKLTNHRRDLSSTSSWSLTSDGKTILDGEYLGLSISWQQVSKLRRSVLDDIRSQSSERLKNKSFARNFSLKKIYGELELKTLVDVGEYHRIDNWVGYCDYLGSGSSLMQPPNPILLRGYKSKNLNY